MKQKGVQWECKALLCPCYVKELPQNFLVDDTQTQQEGWTADAHIHSEKGQKPQKETLEVFVAGEVVLKSVLLQFEMIFWNFHHINQATTPHCK